MSFKVFWLFISFFIVGRNSSPVKMTFGVAYDKNAKHYNLMVNQKPQHPKQPPRLLKKVRSVATAEAKLAFKHNDKKIKRLLKLLEKRAYITVDPSDQNSIDKLKETIQDINTKAKTEVIDSFDRANRDAIVLFDKMKKDLRRRMKRINVSGVLKKQRKSLLDAVKRHYRKQIKTIGGGVSEAKGKIDSLLPKLKKEVVKRITKLQKKESRKRKKQDKAVKDNYFVLSQEKKKVDKKIRKNLDNIKPETVKKNLDFILQKEENNINEFVNGFESKFNQKEERSLILQDRKRLLNSLIGHKPVWLLSPGDFGVKQTKPKNTSRTVRKLIDQIKNKNFPLIVKDGKRYAYLKDLDLYLQTNDNGQPNELILSSLLSSLQSKLQSPNNPIDFSFIQNQAVKNLASQNEESFQQPGKKRSLMMAALGGAAVGGAVGGGGGGALGGAAAGAAAGAMKAVAEKKEVFDKTMKLMTNVEVMQVKERIEMKGQHSLFLVKVRMLTNFAYLKSVAKMVLFRLDKKYEDLFKLMSDQEID